MKAAYCFILILVCGILSPALPVQAQQTGSQTITILVEDINEISISGGPGNLTINTASAGSQPDDETDSSTTYSLTTNCSSKKISGAINVNMPQGVTLQVNMAAPSGASSLGYVTLSSSPSDLVTGITKIHATGLTITYRLSATVSAGIVSLGSKKVTFTITD